MLWGLCRIAVVAGAVALAGASAGAAPCFNPFALGVHRVLPVDPRAMPLIGSHDYGVTLPLAPGEIVLTFDDGPQAPFTNKVLKALADECVRATFFLVGRQAAADPQLARQVHAAGHNIGTHTESHLLYRMPADRAAYEIDAGIVSVGAAFGSQRALAPFFRFPGLFRTPEAEQHLRSRGLMAWSVDVDSYDWKNISAGHMLGHTLADLEKRRGGILLMHDVQAKTALLLPTLLAEIKKRGYRIVHVVPSSDYPMTAPIAAPAAPVTEPPARMQFPVSSVPEPDDPARRVRMSGELPPAPPPVVRPGANGPFEAIFNASSPPRFGR